jgi:hypothetical protein
MKPKVSIIMPVLNGEKYIGEAVASILAQTYTGYELIIVDDGSTDSTPALLRSYGSKLKLTCVRHASPMGIARSVNDGIRHASGEFIAFLDHDDLWFPEFLETQVAYLERHSEAGMVHCDFQTVDAKGDIIESSVARCRNRRRPSGSVFSRLFMDSFIVGNSVLIRKACFDRLGLFDETLRWGDYHMWLRIARHYHVDYVDRVLTKYRQHSTQGTRDVAGRDPRAEPAALCAIRKFVEQHPDVVQELGAKVIRRRMGFCHFDEAYAWWLAGEKKNARICLRKAIRSWPTNLKYLGLYVVCLLPPPIADGLKQAWHALRRVAVSPEVRPAGLGQVSGGTKGA